MDSIAGGGGISACILWLLHLAAKSGLAQIRTKRVVLVWAMKEADHFDWVEPDLVSAVTSKAERLEIVLSFCITRRTISLSSKLKAGSE